MNKFIKILALTLLISIVFAPNAHAYMDPGTGSFVFQVIIASAIGGLFVIKSSWGKIVNYFKNLRGKSE